VADSLEKHKRVLPSVKAILLLASTFCVELPVDQRDKYEGGARADVCYSDNRGAPPLMCASLGCLLSAMFENCFHST